MFLNFLATEQTVMVQNKTASLEFCLDDLGYLEHSLETRAIVMSKVLKDLGLHYKRYYISESLKDFRRVKKPKESPPDMSMAFLVDCDGDYLAFAWYNYRKRMNDIIILKKSLEASSDPCN